ncbi:MAG: DUF2185 domain-containing protein [Bacteroidia bacterium]
MAKKKNHPKTGGPIEKALNGVCMASAQITEDKLPVGFMYRESPEEDLDSGWRFLSGKEDDDYLENENNYGVFDVDFIVGLDSVVRNYIHLPVGSELERNGNKFIPYSEE